MISLTPSKKYRVNRKHFAWSALDWAIGLTLVALLLLGLVFPYV